jgi:hypothetical protein
MLLKSLCSFDNIFVDSVLRQAKIAKNRETRKAVKAKHAEKNEKRQVTRDQAALVAAQSQGAAAGGGAPFDAAAMDVVVNAPPAPRNQGNQSINQLINFLNKYLFYLIAKGRFGSDGRRGLPQQPSAAAAARGMAVDGFAAKAPRRRGTISENYYFNSSH